MKNPKFVVNPCTGNYFIFTGDGENQGYYWVTSLLKSSKTMLCSSYETLKFPKSLFKRCSIFPVKIPNVFEVPLRYEKLRTSYLNPFIPKHTQNVRNFHIFLKTCTLQKTVPLVVFYNDKFKLYCNVCTGRNIYYENK